MKLFTLAARFAIAFVFFGAALPKLTHRREFFNTVANYDVLPPSLVRPVANALPWVELFLAASLLLGFATRQVAWVLLILLSALTSAVVVNLLRGRRIDCGCFAVAAPKRIGWGTVARNCTLAALAATVALEVPPWLSILPMSASIGTSPVDSSLVGACVGGALAVALARLGSQAYGFARRIAAARRIIVGLTP